MFLEQAGHGNHIIREGRWFMVIVLSMQVGGNHVIRVGRWGLCYQRRYVVTDDRVITAGT